MKEGNPTDRYTRQINRALDYIATHMDGPLDIRSLAQSAGLSPFYFHRVFSAAMGESPARYVVRKRLERAAICLRDDPGRTVSDIASEVGFGSVHVFCRNFKRFFGMTAEAYRRKAGCENGKNRPSEHNIGPYGRSYAHYLCSRKSLKIESKMVDCEFKIEYLETTHAVYCRHYGSYAEMQGAFEKLMRWAFPKGLVSSDCRLAAVYHDDPEVTLVEKLTSDACLIVARPVKTDGEIGLLDLAAGKYAVGRFEIPWEDFRAAWQCMYRLIGEYGYRCCGLPFERYLNRPTEHPEGKWIVDICIPVTAR